jgi:hypothetical protein
MKDRLCWKVVGLAFEADDDEVLVLAELDGINTTYINVYKVIVAVAVLF